MDVHRVEALAKGRQRKAEKAAFREQLFSKLTNLPADSSGILRLMGMVVAARLKRWITESEGRSIERTLRTVAQSYKAEEFYAYRREAERRNHSAAPNASLGIGQDSEETSRLLEELDRRAALYEEKQSAS